MCPAYYSKGPTFIGFDFGTTASAVAFTGKHFYNNGEFGPVRYIKQWSPPRFTDDKVPTLVSYNGQGGRWGFQAEVEAGTFAVLPPSHRRSSSSIAEPLVNISQAPKKITNLPHLDLLYFPPFILSSTSRHLFQFLRCELAFYHIQYTIQYTIRHGGLNTQINTPRFTTVFGGDETSKFITATASLVNNDNFESTNTSTLVEAKSQQPTPRQIPRHTAPNPHIHASSPPPPQSFEAAIGDGSTYN
ncbi:hypothetical protein BDW59DRAFT_160955 [Aspergillus cavernicola]|uniref:Uncharacterized protein n=1 Tax=Aspergillus cavernicola TaxID=176166 RepID=A0ABR4IFB7_9EURO